MSKHIRDVNHFGEAQRVAEYRRTRLDIAARLLAVPVPYQFSVEQSVAVADALIATNEATPVPDKTNPSDATNNT